MKHIQEYNKYEVEIDDFLQDVLVSTLQEDHTDREPDYLSTVMHNFYNIKGFDPTYKDNLYLIIAVNMQHQNVVEILLKDPRVDPSAQDNKPLKSAIAINNIPILKLLLNSPNIRIDKNDQQLLGYTAHQNYVFGFALLLTKPEIDLNGDDGQIMYYVYKNKNPKLLTIVNLYKSDPEAYRQMSFEDISNLINFL